MSENQADAGSGPINPPDAAVPHVHAVAPPAADANGVSIRLIRHACILIEHRGHRILVDPMLDPPETQDSIAKTGPYANRRNPMTPLPMPVEQLLTPPPDAVMVTHTHFDHWDETAKRLLPKDVPLVCPAHDAASFRKWGFTRVMPVNDNHKTELQLPWAGAPSVVSTGGKHGTGLVGLMMGKVVGFVLRFPGEVPDRQLTVYIAGDTINCGCVEEALQRHHPNVVVVNCGGAALQFALGTPIVMTAEHVTKLFTQVPPATEVVAVHMETINHCRVRRADLQAAFQSARLDAAGRHLWTPADGEARVFAMQAPYVEPPPACV